MSLEGNRWMAEEEGHGEQKAEEMDVEGDKWKDMGIYKRDCGGRGSLVVIRRVEGKREEVEKKRVEGGSGGGKMYV